MTEPETKLFDVLFSRIEEGFTQHCCKLIAEIRDEDLRCTLSGFPLAEEQRLLVEIERGLDIVPGIPQWSVGLRADPGLANVLQEVANMLIRGNRRAFIIAAMALGRSEKIHWIAYETQAGQLAHIMEGLRSGQVHRAHHAQGG